MVSFIFTVSKKYFWSEGIKCSLNTIAFVIVRYLSKVNCRINFSFKKESYLFSSLDCL